MAMVGLFWITEDAVYVGAEPIGTASGVRLTEDGVETLGLGNGASWSWDQVRRIEARDLVVRSAGRRLASMAIDSLVVLVTGDGELPPAFTVHLETADDTVDVSALPAVAGGIYPQAERELSGTLLERLADGGAAVADLLAWRREQPDDSTPRREEREALLRKWAGE
ncbi:hypothetical protein [Streptomyces sp. NBC_00038]|uniref:hypothetical protein n=1 Tax=Streptomyces sp. NBC_00038 TaxID=2903615 RepID=UPI00225B5C63|nr:hypothetical protein [Streptomyces sp. NBC_00038]MCX5559233.1 hypothetical protein [Streptomyces sp. NBC_00038]